MKQNNKEINSLPQELCGIESLSVPILFGLSRSFQAYSIRLALAEQGMLWSQRYWDTQKQPGEPELWYLQNWLAEDAPLMILNNQIVSGWQRIFYLLVSKNCRTSSLDHGLVAAWHDDLQDLCGLQLAAISETCAKSTAVQEPTLMANKLTAIARQYSQLVPAIEQRVSETSEALETAQNTDARQQHLQRLAKQLQRLDFLLADHPAPAKSKPLSAIEMLWGALLLRLEYLGFGEQLQGLDNLAVFAKWLEQRPSWLPAGLAGRPCRIASPISSRLDDVV